MESLKPLRIFYMAVKLNSISKAAESERIDRTAASRQIKNLEDECGYDLFERKPNMVVLTQEGRIFYDRVQKILELSKDILKKDVGVIKILTTHSLAEFILPKMLSAYIKKNPDARIKIEADDYMKLPYSGAYDIIFGPQAPSEENMKSVSFKSQNTFGIYGHPSYFKVKGRLANVSELDSHDLIVYSDEESAPLYMKERKE